MNLECDVLLSTSAFKFNLRRYNEAEESGLSVQGIYPKGDSGAANMAAGGRADL